MSQKTDIFSIRLVIADFYLEKPLRGLDPCYSEFRGKEIKRVPIIRIFGSNSEGQKTCMHVHGVFPYLYIPYESKEFENVNKAIYNIAFSLDKAINISLGQGSSAAQHVFKIQLVKGIPFYGYHRSEHQYLKIYMYNPRFVRRAANLLQNGAILGKVFHPHESHVPYVLQFMIDYNLYGMSFVHVPLEVVKFRRNEEEDVINFVGKLNDAQILSTTLAKKQTCSSLEVDIGSNFILNRFQLVTKRSDSKHSNPGIEAIWHDEDIRRQKLITSFEDDEEKLKTIPPLEIPPTQERPNVHPTESEAFYRVGLTTKLMALEMSLEQTLNNSMPLSEPSVSFNTGDMSKKETRRTFNLKKLLANSVYPDECPANEQLMDASCIANHISGNSIFVISSQSSENSENPENGATNRTIVAESEFFDDTIIDEDLLNLTQEAHVPLNASLRIEDMELLDVLQQLEEHNENPIDLDSSLAPLSQPHKDFELTPEMLDKEIIANSQLAAVNESTSDNECDDLLDDFSIVLDDIDELLLKLSQSQTTELPQVDGADDLVTRTPPKSKKNMSCFRQQITPPQSPKTPKRNTTRSPIRSPRTPKSNVALKYAPLPLIITNRSDKKTSEIQQQEEKSFVRSRFNFNNSNYNSSSPMSLHKKLAITELRRKTISSAKELEDLEANGNNSERTTTPKRSKKSEVDLEKTHITCALTPRRKSERLLKVCNAKSIPAYVNQNSSKNLNNTTPKKIEKTNSKTKSVEKIKIKKVLVRLPKCDLVQMAKEFQNSRRTKNVPTNFSETRQFEISKTIENNASKEINLQQVENNNIEKNLSELMHAFQKNINKNTKKIQPNSELRKSTRFVPPINSENSELSPKSIKVEKPATKTNSDNSELSSISSNNEKQTIEKIFENSEMSSSSKSVSKQHTKRNSVKLNLSLSLKNNKKRTLSTNTTNSEFIRNSTDINLHDISENTELLLDSRNIDEQILRLTPNSAEGLLYQKYDKSSDSKKDTTVIINLDSDEEVEISSRPEALLIKQQESCKEETLVAQKHHNTRNTPENHIKRNLSELVRLFQNVENSNCFENNSEIGSNPSSSTCIEVSQLNKISIQSTSLNEDELDEEIAASDTEAEQNTKLLKQTPSYKRLRRSFLRRKSSNDTPGNTQKTPVHTETPCTSAEALRGLCDLSTMSPSIFSEYSSPGCTPKVSPTVAPTEVILAPLIFPPTREETLKACSKLKIYEYEYQEPFYSNPEDITKAKEVGFTVLQIPGNKLSDCLEFQSVLGSNAGGLMKWRRETLCRMVDPSTLKLYGNAERMREFFGTKKRIVIQPQLKPPSRHDAKLWLKAKEMLQQKNKIQVDQDSPIKVRRQKITMMFNDETAGGGGDAEGDDMDASSCSLTLTPLTPGTPYTKDIDNDSEFADGEVTPLSTNSKLTPGTSIDKGKSRRRSMRKKSVKTSLNEKLKAAAEKEMAESEQFKESDSLASTLTFSQQSDHSSNDSSSISSQVVLAELERSSFVKRLQSEKKDKFDVSFGLSSASLDNTFGFKVNLENLQEAKADIECNYLTTIVMELFTPTREDLYPNPEFDEIRCIFYVIDNNIPDTIATEDPQSQSSKLSKKACGYILLNDSQDILQNEGKIHGIDADIAVKIVKTEYEALEALLELCALWDPDILAGYEIEMSSWGYLIDRAKVIGLNIAPLLSRVPTQKVRDFIDEDRDQFTDLDVEMKLCGRILLDVWRLMRSEIALTSYTFENVMYHILHKRCPWHGYRDLTTWFASPCSRWIVLEYYLERVEGILSLLDQLDLLGRTSEMAKLIGIQFYEVLSRGSQFRVESMMLRIAKPKNLVPLSPSVQQRAHMRAPEYLPLILEPQSRFYADPLIVLDFQSLYPSMIIGYNYCFSTCLGRVEHLGQSEPFEFGASQLRVSPTMLRKLINDDLVNISPCGVVFVKSSVREGILPRMLTEILDTRQMVKQSMKLHKTNSALQRILHSRQLGLKLMANVTYGYTAANFSGRMPAVEVGDSVVAKGRETLERTIKMVEANEKWGVKVVYGDTDSLFVLVPGRNRQQAFKIGEEIAAAATKNNPQPVKLKLEKVYQPCILQTKKRYVGYMYETPEQTEPVYEAKGIETVRRDGCPAVAKMLEKVLRILFETADVSQVKQYVCRQFTKLLSGRANLQDLIFAKEFRGLNGYRPTACVPALELTRKWIQTDPRHIPRRGERVPFIITNGPPGVPLIRLVRSPHDVLADSGLKINAIYYITKAIIPPLNRCLLLIGADVNDWFSNLPRKILMTPALSTGQELITTNQQKKSTISQYFSTTNCIVDCGRHTKDGICNICTTDAMKCVVVLHAKIAKIERSYQLTQQICQACCGRVGDLKCRSLDCPVLYVLEVKRRDLQQIEYFRNLLTKF